MQVFVYEAPGEGEEEGQAMTSSSQQPEMTQYAYCSTSAPPVITVVKLSSQ